VRRCQPVVSLAGERSCGLYDGVSAQRLGSSTTGSPPRIPWHEVGGALVTRQQDRSLEQETQLPAV